jgi:hypothetical protein
VESIPQYTPHRRHFKASPGCPTQACFWLEWDSSEMDRRPPPFSSHFSCTAITDLHQNRCDDSSIVHHRGVRPSPETNASSASNHRLFDNKRKR